MSTEPTSRKKKATKRDKYGNVVAQTSHSTSETAPTTNAGTSATLGIFPLHATVPDFLDPNSKPRKLTNIEVLVKEFTGGTEEGLDSLRDAVYKAATIVIDKASPQARKQYENAKHSYHICVKVISKTIVEDPWVREVVEHYAPLYLDFRVQISKGQAGGKVKATTVCGWFSSFVVAIAKNAHEPNGQSCGGVILYREGLRDKLEEKLHTAIKQYNLDRHTSRKGKSFGLLEAQLCIEHALLVSQSRGRLVRIQEICSINLGLTCGVRPSGLAAAHPEYAKEGKYLKTGDIRIFGRGGPANWDVQFTFKNHKGLNTTNLGRTTTVWFRALSCVKNVLFDTWWYVIYMWARGCLGKYKTLQDLLTTEDNELMITSPDEPFFLTSIPGGTKLIPGEPLSTKRLSGNVKSLSEGAGLQGLTFYDLRRDIANDLSNKIGSTQAGLVLGHEESRSTVIEHYSHGAGNYDLLGIRTGEASDQFMPGTESRLDLRRRTGTAVCMLSKAIASLSLSRAESGEDSGDEGSDSGVADGHSLVSTALHTAKKGKKKAMKEARNKAEEEDEEVQTLESKITSRWEEFFEAMTPGSPLQLRALKFKRRQQNIKKIQQLAEFKAVVEEDSGFEERAKTAENALRAAYTARNTRSKDVRRKGAAGADKDYQVAQSKQNIDTISHKDAAIKFAEQPSSVIAETIQASAASKASTSKTQPISAPSEPFKTSSNTTDGREEIEEMNREEEEVPISEALETHKALLNFKPNNLSGKPQAGPSVRQILDDAIAIENKPSEELDREDPDLFRGGEPAPPWVDANEPETIKVATIAEVRVALIQLVLDPILLERECEARKETDKGYLCHLCRQLDPTAKLREYTHFTKLNNHIWQQHTEWNDLVLKMACGDGYICPGACGAAQRFDSIDVTRDHCLSTACKDQDGFLAMKATHDEVQKRRYEVQNKYVNKETGHSRDREKTRNAHLRYFGSLTRDDLFALADKFNIPHDELAPHVDLMLKNFQFVSKTLLED